MNENTKRELRVGLLLRYLVMVITGCCAFGANSLTASLIAMQASGEHIMWTTALGVTLWFTLGLEIIALLVDTFT